MPMINFDESQQIPIKASIKFSDAQKFAKREISASTVWKMIEFFAIPGLSNVLQTEEKVEFPISTGIVGE